MVECLLCGARVKHLPPHLHRSHGMTFKQYLERFKVPPEKKYELLTGYTRTPWNKGLTAKEMAKILGEERYRLWQRKRAESIRRYYYLHPERIEMLKRVGIETVLKLSQTTTSRVEKVLLNLLKLYAQEYHFEVEYQQPLWNVTIPDITVWIDKKTSLLIYVDGCFFHCCPICGVQPEHEIQRNVVKHDAEVERWLRKQNMNYVRVWEHEIKNNISWVLSVLLGVIKALREGVAVKVQGRLSDLKEFHASERPTLKKWLRFTT